MLVQVKRGADGGERFISRCKSCLQQSLLKLSTIRLKSDEMLPSNPASLHTVLRSSNSHDMDIVCSSARVRDWGLATLAVVLEG